MSYVWYGSPTKNFICIKFFFLMKLLALFFRQSILQSSAKIPAIVFQNTRVNFRLLTEVEFCFDDLGSFLVVFTTAFPRYLWLMLFQSFGNWGMFFCLVYEALIHLSVNICVSYLFTIRKIYVKTIIYSKLRITEVTKKQEIDNIYEWIQKLGFLWIRSPNSFISYN